MNKLSFNAQSPFDSLKRVDEHGNEYWNARELMLLLGYKTWQKFDKVIENAKENLETVTSSSVDHIIPTVKVVKRPQGGGSNLLDYKLTRLASYHVALSCDSRGNDNVKLAKHYFAMKTREAEIQAKPKTALELAKEQVKLLEQLEVQKIIIENQEKDLLRQSEVIDELFNYSSIIRVAKFNNCSETNFKWQTLKAVSRVKELEIKKVPDPRFGYKNLYHHEVWRYAYPNINLPETNIIKINQE